MTQVVRKQVYLRKDQELRLKRAAEERGITESEVIRRGLDQVLAEVEKDFATSTRGRVSY